MRQALALERLGARVGFGALRELLPLGARAAVRALRTRAVAQVRPDWVWPAWLQRQLDPGSDAFVAPGELPLAGNVTLRNWTMVGNPGSRREAVVDPTGLVSPWPGSWSLDWAVLAGGSWRFAALEDRPRQRLVARAPIVETSLDVPGGELVQTVYAVSGPEELVVVELRNRAADAVEVVVGVRPYDPEGLAVVRRIEVDGTLVRVDGRRALLLERPPARAACSTSAGPDAFRALAGSDPRRLPGRRVHDPAGLAHAVLAYRLGPGERLRMAVPLTAAPTREQPVRVGVGELPSVASTADRWRRECDRGMRVQLPDGRLQDAVDANRAYLLLFHDGDEITPGPRTYHRFWFRDAAYLLLALDQWGLHEEAAAVLGSYPRRQRRDGLFASQAGEWDGNGAAIWAIAEHHRLTGDDALLRALTDSVRAGGEWIARARERAHRRRGSPDTAGLLAPGRSAEHLGPPDRYYWDNFWSLRGLHDAAWLLGRAGDDAGARAAAGEAASLGAAIVASLEAAERRLEAPVMPAGPARGLDAGMIGSLVACWPLRLLDARDDRVTGTLDAIRERFTVGDAFFHGIYHAGLGSYLTLQLAQIELQIGDERAWRRLRWLVDAATPTFTWPEAIHPRLGTGCYGDGHHGWAAAAFLSFVRSVLVREDGTDGLVLLSLLPREWHGHAVAVVDAPTHAGRISYELAWDARRPVLRWECERDGVHLRAPSLDRRWTTSARSGEARLGGNAPTESVGRS